MGLAEKTEVERYEGEVCRIVREIYERHPAGCCWCVAIDDGNLDDETVAFCRGYCSGAGCSGCYALHGPMRMLSETQRKRLYEKGWRI